MVVLAVDVAPASEDFEWTWCVHRGGHGAVKVGSEGSVVVSVYEHEYLRTWTWSPWFGLTCMVSCVKVPVGEVVGVLFELEVVVVVTAWLTVEVWLI